MRMTSVLQRILVTLLASIVLVSVSVSALVNASAEVRDVSAIDSAPHSSELPDPGELSECEDALDIDAEQEEPGELLGLVDVCPWGDRRELRRGDVSPAPILTGQLEKRSPMYRPPRALS